MFNFATQLWFEGQEHRRLDLARNSDYQIPTHTPLFGTWSRNKILRWLSCILKFKKYPQKNKKKKEREKQILNL